MPKFGAWEAGLDGGAPYYKGRWEEDQAQEGGGEVKVISLV